MSFKDRNKQLIFYPLPSFFTGLFFESSFFLCGNHGICKINKKCCAISTLRKNVNTKQGN